MRLAIIMFGAASLAACGPAGGSGEAAEDSGVTIELPPEPAPPPPAAPEPAPPPAPPEPEAEEKAAAPEAAPKEEAPAPKKKEEPPEPEPEPEPPAREEAPSPGGRPPLPDATIARTIDRIGYRCGNVVSASRVEGSGTPTYRIACSSGETYRGTNRGGRMYFRPWDR